MAIVRVDPIDITPSAGLSSWTDVDLTAYLGDDAGDVAGVYIRIQNNYTAGRSYGARKNGSSDTMEQYVPNGNGEKRLFYAGIDSSNILELYRTNSLVSFYLIGYVTNDSGSFFTNSVDKSIGSDSTWTDIDISSDTGGDTAKFAFLFDVVSNINFTLGFRENSSTDTFTASYSYGETGYAIGVDGSEILEGYTDDSTNTDIYLIGYLTDNVTSFTNRKDYQTATTNSWVETDLSTDVPAGSSGVFVYSTNDLDVRQTGSNFNDFNTAKNSGPNWGWYAVDDDRNIDQYTASSSYDLYITGYTTGDVVPPYIENSPITAVKPVKFTVSSTSTWEDLDLSSYIPADAEGAYFKAAETGGTERTWGIRMNGSSDTITGGLEDYSTTYIGMGVDSNRVCEIYAANASVEFWLVGYIPDGQGYFLSNATDVSLSSTNTWTDIDITASVQAGDTAGLAFLQVHHTGSPSALYGFRKNGSADGNRTYVYSADMRGALMAVDSNEIFEGNVASTAIDFYLNGYLIADNITTYSDLEDRDVAVGTSIVDFNSIPVVPYGNTGVFFSMIGTSEYRLRTGFPYDEVFIAYEDSDISQGQYGWAAINQFSLLEAQNENTGMNLYTFGYTSPAVVTPPETRRIFMIT